MDDLDDGLYVVQVTADQEPEIARYAGEVFLLHGIDEVFRPDEFHRIGHRVEIDRMAMTAASV